MNSYSWKAKLDGNYDFEKIRTLYTVMLNAIYEKWKNQSVINTEYIFVVSPRLVSLLSKLSEFEQEPYHFVRDNCNRIGRLNGTEIFRDVYANIYGPNDFVKCYDKNGEFARIEVIIER